MTGRPGAMAADRLLTYRRKRDLSASREPAGSAARNGAGSRFVVQEHHARRLHWDFRLEHDGVLVSWALPHGLPLTQVEHLPAAHTEDHPLDYLRFQGTIPEGGYGAGEVTVWDRGTYECESFEDGKVVVRLHGDRVSGRY